MMSKRAAEVQLTQDNVDEQYDASEEVCVWVREGGVFLCAGGHYLEHNGNAVYLISIIMRICRLASLKWRQKSN